MPVNAVIVSWQGPGFEVTDPDAIAEEGERIEARLDLGAYDDPIAVLGPANAELQRYKNERRQVKLAVEPLETGDVFLVDLDLGDTPNVVNETGTTTATRFIGFDLKVLENGRLSWSPEFGDQTWGEEGRFQHSDISTVHRR